MTNENFTEEISRSIRGIRHDIGWIPMTLIIMAGTGMTRCSHERSIANSLEKLRIDRQQDRPESHTQVADVLGNEQPERFYEFNGQRVYLEFDGKPVESYFSQKPIPGGIR